MRDQPAQTNSAADNCANEHHHGLRFLSRREKLSANSIRRSDRGFCGCRRSAASALAARTVSDSLISTTGLTLTLRGAEIPEPDSRPCLHSIPHSTSVATIPNAFGGRNTGKGRSRRQFRGSVSDSVELLFRRATEARSGVTKNAISHVSLVQGQGELSGENLDTMSTLALSSPAPSSPWANRLNGGSYRASRDPA